MAKLKLSRQKMNGEERKLSIVKSAIPIFAEKGFHGTTIRNIAKAAGISEALLYQHFSSKEEIYLSLGKYNEVLINILIKAFKEREPSSKTLVEMIYCLIMIILSDIHGKTDLQQAFDRFFAYSILENVDFTRRVFRTYEHDLAPIWDECMKEAGKNNELKENYKIKNNMWLIHHLAMAVDFLNIAGDKIFKYKGTYDDFLGEIVQFALMGSGLKDEVIDKYYNPPELKKLLKSFFEK